MMRFSIIFIISLRFFFYSLVYSFLFTRVQRKCTFLNKDNAHVSVSNVFLCLHLFYKSSLEFLIHILYHF